MSSESKRKSIAIDMDGVLADVEAQYLDWYEKEYGEMPGRESMLGLMECDALPNDAIAKFLVTPGFFRTLPVMEGAVEAVKDLMQDFNVYVVSAAMEFPLSLYEKKLWLEEHFPFIHWRNIIFCGDKSVIDTDFLIDDHCKNLDHCPGKPLMFTAFHNVNKDHHQRVNHWSEIPDVIRDLTHVRQKLAELPSLKNMDRPRW